MKNLLNPQDFEDIVQRLESITPLSTKCWGKMEADQMVVHVKDLVDIALGYKVAMAQGPMMFRTIIGKFLVFYVLPWRKGKMSTPNEMDASQYGVLLSDFDSDKYLLNIRFKEFIAASSFSLHPYFGKISKKGWGRLLWKHTNHHLLQFGA